ncbi:MAG: DUF5335 family protein [Thermoguttaceae bacterium]|jgi:hypothetical protein
MPFHEIPRQDWESFFDRFSRQHVNAQVDAEVRGRDVQGRIAEHLALQGITANLEEEDKIQIIMGDPSRENVTTHVIEAPNRVTLREDAGHEQVEIEAVDGTLTTVSL